jgi:hypothetical protein
MRRRSGSSWSCRGVVNTDIATNSRRALGLPEWEQLSDAQLLELIPDAGRAVLIEMGLLPEDFSADDLRQAIPRLKDEFWAKGFSAVQAATIILDGVPSGAWRILVGEEAKIPGKQVRANPEAHAHVAARIHHRRARHRGAATGCARGCLSCRSADHDAV